jgi:acyl-CoA synthetase (AMP-forming)/AMP-acid ligase II
VTDSESPDTDDIGKFDPGLTQRMIGVMRPVLKTGRLFVVGRDDERLAAFVVLESGASATPETLKQHVRQNLANYKVPREIALLDELPRGSTGKIVRAGLRSKVSD